MYKKIFSVALLCISTTLIYAQRVPGKQLNFSDYKGIPDTTLSFKAFTLCNVTYKVQHPVHCADGNTFRFTKVFTRANFDPQSWIKNKNSIVPQHQKLLLYHEQGHFDLFKVYSIELKHVIERTCFSPENYEKQIDVLNHQLSLKYDQIQRSYDTQTNHGVALREQAVWKQHILDLYNLIKNE